MTVLVTGAAGFIGSNLVSVLRQTDATRRIISVDALSYCGNLENLAAFKDDAQHVFEHANICDRERMRAVLMKHQPDVIFHLAAETHVDRSILGPEAFVRSNVLGTLVLLQEAAELWGQDDKNASKRFVHVSTDEVFGSLPETGLFTEQSPYDPQSPYAASKAASDHLVRAWFNTYGFPAVITNCSNNYGPYQFPEKLIPVVISRVLKNETVPVYGQGLNVRDWLHVHDHCDALIRLSEAGQPGQTYCIGGSNEIRNIDMVNALVDLVDEVRGIPVGTSRHLIRFVKDRPGHDLRYAIDPNKIQQELGWQSRIDFHQGIRQTVTWYLDHASWWQRALSGEHKTFEQQWYRERT